MTQTSPPLTTEQRWIQQLQDRLQQAGLKANFSNDAALEPNSHQVLTTDMLVEGVHFDTRYMSLADVGWRAMAANLSDLASCGARPAWAMASVGTPDHNELNLLYDGILEACQAFGVELAGGDTVKSPQWVLNIAMGGCLPSETTALNRATAQVGDVVAVSGPHGLSAAGLWLLQNPQANLSGYDPLKKAHCRPQPRLALGEALLNWGQNQQQLPAVMDSSDGLADALMQLAKTSEMDLVIDESALVIDPLLGQLAKEAFPDLDEQGLHNKLLNWVLYGGEDFELVVCLPASACKELTGLTPIGTVQPLSAQEGRAWIHSGGSQSELTQAQLFQHFN